MEITISDNDVVTISGVRRNDRIYISFATKNDLYGAVRDTIRDIDSIEDLEDEVFYKKLEEHGIFFEWGVCYDKH